jgi:hypothetical protein
MTTLELDYLRVEDLAARPSLWWRNVLGVVGFTKPPYIAAPTVPVTASMTPSLGATDDLCEVWRVAGNGGLELANGVPVESSPRERVHYRFCEDLLFGSVTIEERAFGDSAALTQATIAAYARIFEVLERTKHPHLVRVWN